MTLEAIERRRRDLESAARRLRVAAMSDPQRTEELADVVVELAASALLAWDVADAATPAPESVVLAARILASRGPSGPYASLPDAVRYASAAAQLAAVQAALGQPEAAGRTLDGLDAWRAQLGRLPLAENLPDPVVLWLLAARARALLATDVPAANACADAAQVRLHAAAAPSYLALAVHLLTADCRWAAGRPDSALAHSRLALDVHRQVVAGLAPTPRPAVAKAAAAPVVAVYEPFAARLALTGATDAAIALRREEVAVLAALGATDQLPAARAGLAAALVDAGRADEASGLGVEPAGAAATPPGSRVDWTPLAPAPAFEPFDAASAQARWRQAEQSAVFAGVAAAAEAERAEGILREQARVAAQRREADRADAERAAERADAAAREREVAERAREAALAAERAEREQEAARAAAEERRRALAEEHRLTVDPDEARAAADELDAARRAVADADGDPAASAAAQDRLASLLRPLAAVEPEYREELAAVLESLVGLLWRLGDPDGSRAAAREAKSLGG
jgi:hypothetical protein